MSEENLLNVSEFYHFYPVTYENFIKNFEGVTLIYFNKHDWPPSRLLKEKIESFVKDFNGIFPEINNLVLFLNYLNEQEYRQIGLEYYPAIDIVVNGKEHKFLNGHDFCFYEKNKFKDRNSFSLDKTIENLNKMLNEIIIDIKMKEIKTA